MKNKLHDKFKIAIVGLGYVGLPLALEFGKKYETIGYDKSKKKISAYENRVDINNELPRKNFDLAKKITFTNNSEDISSSNFIVIAVPTPVNSKNEPDLEILINATAEVAKNVKKGSIVVFESTVYPGVTEEICVPIIEKLSKLKWKKDFFVGYSPERINPGDKKHTLTKITKVISGDSPNTTKVIKKIYLSIIKAGVYEAASIKVAEAAKVIENTQRDLNIAFINELSKIFNKLDIDTKEVLDTAKTKWNFLDFRPGLVGGHCIGVDPYYLTYKSLKINYNPEIILAGRKINDGMAAFVAKKLEEIYRKNNNGRLVSKVLIMGFAFKENCSDYRNSKVLDIYKYFKKKNIIVDIYDPIVSSEDVYNEFDIKLISVPRKNYYDAAILAVPHKNFIDLGTTGISNFCKKKYILFDLKSVFKKQDNIIRL